MSMENDSAAIKDDASKDEVDQTEVFGAGLAWSLLGCKDADVKEEPSDENLCH